MIARGLPVQSILQIERMEAIAEAARPIVMPGDDKESCLIVADYRGAQDSPLGIVRAPHIDVFPARSRLPSHVAQRGIVRP